MKGPYPQIVFHFADKPESLDGILTEKAFFPSYARERIENLSVAREFGCPMVSFCDLRLSELPHHMEKYGHFGIGLTKDWALKSNLNPVAYANKSSDFTNGLLRAIDWLYAELDQSEQYDPVAFNLRNERYSDTLNTLRYIKNYDGPLIRHGQIVSTNYRFADEREWRHVPPHSTHGIWPFLSMKLMDQKAFFNQQLRPFKLVYAPSDVKYLLVPKESDIPALRKTIESLAITADERNHFLARIITSEQVEADF